VLEGFVVFSLEFCVEGLVILSEFFIGGFIFSEDLVELLVAAVFVAEGFVDCLMIL
jgi:hypothetical protein